jgi:hypothetical protein
MGIAIRGLSINLLTQGKYFSKGVQNIRINPFISSFKYTSNILAPYRKPRECVHTAKSRRKFRKSVHIAINNITGDVLELIILIVLLVVAFSYDNWSSN